MDENATARAVAANDSVDDNCSLFFVPGDSANQLSTAAKLLDSIIPPILLLIGLPGNMLSMIVIIRQYKNMSSTAVYLLALAISDSIFLLIGTFVDWLVTVFKFSIREMNTITCKICNFLYIGSAQFSSWILVAITIERIISVMVPHKFKLFCTPRVSVVCVISTCLCLVGINSHFLYGFGNSDTFIGYYGSTCGPLDLKEYQVFYLNIWPWIDLTLVFAIPFVVLSLGNSVILYKLFQIKATKSKIVENDQGNRRSQKSFRSVTLTIVGLNAIFLVCVTPLAIFLACGAALYEWADNIACTDPDAYDYRRGLLELLMSICICLSYINPSVNFILYVLNGTKFRNEIKALLFCKPVHSENVFA